MRGRSVCVLPGVPVGQVMILSDTAIREEIQKENLSISNLEDSSIQPASIDIHIDNKAIYADPSRTLVLDMRRPVYNWNEVNFKDHDFLLRPGMLLLVGTRERFTLGPNLAGVVHGRTSPARHGISVQSGAPWIDPGFDGHLTLKMSVSSDIPAVIYPDMCLAQVVLHYVDRAVANPYGKHRGSKYAGSVGATPASITWRASQ